MSGFVKEPQTEAEVVHNDTLAKDLFRSCPKCGSFDVRVYASQVRATRAKSCQFLGAQILCRCEGDFMVEYGPVALEAAS